MPNHDPSDHPLGCFQAHQALNVLRAVRDLPSLESIFTAEFRPAEYREDKVLVPALVEENLLGSSPTLSERLRAYFGRVERQQQRALEHADIRRAIQTTDVQIRHAIEKSDRGKLLKSKNARWEEANTLSNLEKKRTELAQQEAAIVFGAQQVKDQFDELRAALSEANELKLYGDRLVQLTHQGAYILAILEASPQRHLFGRRLGDILAIGPLLI